MIGRPELVFLDEPTAGLDPQARHATWSLISGLRDAGAGVILTTHYMEEAERLADRVAVVDHGHLVAAGTPAELTGTAGPAQVPGRARPGYRQPDRRAAARERGQGIPGRLLRGRGARPGRPAAARRGDRVVRRAWRARAEPADREPDARGCLPRADRAGAPLVTETTRTLPTPPAPWPSPAPGAAPLHVMVGAQAWLELRTLLRNGEQLVLTLIIPVLLIAAFSQEDLVSYGPGSRIDFLAPGILALAVMSTAFTSQAIATGFERRYGVLKRLGATPLSRRGLIAAKTLTVLAVEVLQSALIVVVALALGWSPRGGAAAAVWSVVLMVAGTAAFSGLALLMAGTLRAEATLAGREPDLPGDARDRRRGVPADQVPRGRAARAAAASVRRAVRRPQVDAAAWRRPASTRPAGARGLGGSRHRLRRAARSAGNSRSLRSPSPVPGCSGVPLGS